MAAKDSTPLEEFRRVTATTMRAVSRKEVNVSFVPDGGSLLGQEARITVPARDLPVEDVSRVRGEADSMALKMRHHDRKMHLRRVPRGETARDIFVIGNARPLDQALQHATTEMLAWLAADWGLDPLAASHCLGQCVRYDVANVFNPAYSVACRLDKSVLPPRKAR